MATDYDAPRKTDDDLTEDSLEELKARRVDKSASSVDVDETEQAEGFELPGADLSNEELSVRVLPRGTSTVSCGPTTVLAAFMKMTGSAGVAAPVSAAWST